MYISSCFWGYPSLIPFALRIWEKKYGKNANHIQKQDTERRPSGSILIDRRSGKGKSSSRPRRTPIQSRAPTYGHEQVHKATPRGSEGIKNPSSAKGRSESIRGKDGLRGKQAEGDRPLHPSWEAKRKQKSAGIVPSQGTKIVFFES